MLYQAFFTGFILFNVNVTYNITIKLIVNIKLQVLSQNGHLKIIMFVVVKRRIIIYNEKPME